MNKNILLRFGLIVLLASSNTFGQGYRGKRFTASYQPAISMINPPYDFGHLMMHHKLNVGFAIGKHLSINLTGSYTNTREWTDFYLYQHYTSMQINDLSGGINIMYYYKNFQSFAPLGRYVGLGIEYGRQNTDREVSYIDPVNYYKEIDRYYDNTKTGRLILFSVIFGKNYVIKNNLLLGYGIQFGMTNGTGPILRHCIKPQFTIGYIF